MGSGRRGAIAAGAWQRPRRWLRTTPDGACGESTVLSLELLVARTRGRSPPIRKVAVTMGASCEGWQTRVRVATEGAAAGANERHGQERKSSRHQWPSAHEAHTQTAGPLRSGVCGPHKAVLVVALTAGAGCSRWRPHPGLVLPAATLRVGRAAVLVEAARRGCAAAAAKD